MNTIRHVTENEPEKPRHIDFLGISTSLNVDSWRYLSYLFLDISTALEMTSLVDSQAVCANLSLVGVKRRSNLAI